MSKDKEIIKSTVANLVKLDKTSLLIVKSTIDALHAREELDKKSA